VAQPEVPLFSVIICTYNRSDIVVGGIEAVLNQTLTDFELLVIDDGSSDDTAEVCSRIADPRLQLISRDNGGLSAARNTGLELAKGRFVIFIDDDDRASPEWLAELAKTVSDAPDPKNVAVVSCGARMVDPDGELHMIRLPKAQPLPFSNEPTPVLMLAGCFAVRRTVHDAVGGYEESILTTHQTELALRLLPYCDEHGMSVLSVAKPLVDIEHRLIADRPLNQPGPLLDSIEFVLHRHEERLRRCRSTHASYSSMAGVSAAQIGQMNRARRHLWRAVRSRPSPKHLGRLAMAYMPGAARHWRRHWD